MRKVFQYKDHTRLRDLHWFMGEATLPHMREIRALESLLKRKKKEHEKQIKVMWRIRQAQIYKFPQELQTLRNKIAHEERHVFMCPWCKIRTRHYNEHTGLFECAYCDIYYDACEDEDFWEDEDFLDDINEEDAFEHEDPNYVLGK